MTSTTTFAKQPLASIDERMARIPKKLDVGDKMPDVTLSRFKEDSNDTVPFSTYEAVRNLSFVYLRTLPGAFTPTCDGTDMPNLAKNLDKLSGYDKIIVLTSDTIDVSRAWARVHNLVGKVEFWSDPTGVLLDYFDSVNNSGNRGRGYDYHRMAFMIENGIVARKAKEESNKECKLTNVETFTKV